jgi:hypothetical protein
VRKHRCSSLTGAGWLVPKHPVDFYLNSIFTIHAFYLGSIFVIGGSSAPACPPLTRFRNGSGSWPVLSALG